jgi:hypothetical protein
MDMVILDGIPRVTRNLSAKLLLLLAHKNNPGE